MSKIKCNCLNDDVYWCHHIVLTLLILYGESLKGKHTLKNWNFKMFCKKGVKFDFIEQFVDFLIKKVEINCPIFEYFNFRLFLESKRLNNNLNAFLLDEIDSQLFEKKSN